MGGLEQIRAYLVAQLEEAGLTVVTAWSSTKRGHATQPLVAVSIRQCDSSGVGFRDYLGERYDEDSQQWQELYGRKLRLTFGLDLYAPKDSGESALNDLFEQVLETLGRTGPQGIALYSLSRGETQFDSESGLLFAKAEAECGAYLYAIAEAGGSFLDFIVKGERV